MSSSQQSTQSTTNTQPWSAQIPYLQQAFGGASNALSTAQNTGVAPTQFTASMTPDQLATFNSMVGYGMNNNGATTQGNAGTAATGLGANASTTAIGNMLGLDPSTLNSMQGAVNGANQYVSGLNIPGQVNAAMQSAEEAANSTTLPGIQRGAAGTNNQNSTASGVEQGIVNRGLGEQAGNLSAELSNNAYATGAGLASNINNENLNATMANNQALSNAGGANEQLGLGALSSAIANQGNLYNLATQGGSGLYDANQLGLNNQQQAWNFSQSSPFTALQNFYNIIGSGQWGGTSNTNSTTTTTPSMLNTIGGLLGAGNSLFGSSGMFGSGTAGGGAFAGLLPF